MDSGEVETPVAAAATMTATESASGSGTPRHSCTGASRVLATVELHHLGARPRFFSRAAAHRPLGPLELEGERNRRTRAAGNRRKWGNVGGAAKMHRPRSPHQYGFELFEHTVQCARRREAEWLCAVLEHIAPRAHIMRVGVEHEYSTKQSDQ